MSFLRSLFLLIVCVVIAAFVGVNWSVLNQPEHLSLIVTEVTWPLGLVMLGLMALLAAAFIAWMVYTQSLMLVEARRHARELAAQRELADKAETSRYSRLRTHMDDEVQRLTQTMENQTRETLSRIDRAETGLRERPIDTKMAHLVDVVSDHSRTLHSRIDRLEMGLREHPLDNEIVRLTQVVENNSRDMHARVDRLEMGLRDGLSNLLAGAAAPAVGHTPAPAPAPTGLDSAEEPTMRPDDPGVRNEEAAEDSPRGADPVGKAVP